MERDIRLEAVVTNSRPMGEMHRSVTLFSGTMGLVNAVVFGGRKGKKAALAPLFSYGTFQLYYNPVNDSYSITEEESEFTPTGIMQSLEATYTASYFCEICSRVGADEHLAVYSLLRSSLAILDSNPEQHRKILIDFTWKLIQISGLATDLKKCPSCEKTYADNETLFFSTQMNTPVCRTCADTDRLFLMPGSRKYLQYTLPLSIEGAFEVELYESNQIRLRDFLLGWISLFAQGPLKTVRSGLL